MTNIQRAAVVLTLLSGVPALPARVQAQAAAPPAVVGALLKDLAMAEQKLLGLAEAIPESAYAWRPSAGARSVGEVMVHIAADNWFLPTAAGTAAPAETGVKAGDYATVQAYEGRRMTKAESIAAVRSSFAHLRQSMERTDNAFLGSELDLFGMKMSGTDLWVLTTTHLHEHLGQLIAYARANDIVPPWSR
jgi:uncharacterized damage-inducible protein DinB